MPKDRTNKPKSTKSDHKSFELIADLQRLQAEFINYKRRAEEDRLRAVQTGKEQAVLALLPVLDNIERAIAHEPNDIKDHAWVQGVASIAAQLESQMESIGLIKIGEIGEVFDPNLHEAVVFEDGDGDNEVIDAVIQNGYQFGDNVIRPAMVKVKKSNDDK
jgi:molecular chaperone GrpE